MIIAWDDPGCSVSHFFTVKEACYMPQWSRLANEDDGINDGAKAALIDLFQRMDRVRSILSRPINVHCAFRSVKYNSLVGGAPFSAHIAKTIPGSNPIYIAACDFDARIIGDSLNADCDRVRDLLRPELSGLDCRMENNPGKPWIHIDTRNVPMGGNRVFNP